MQKRGPYRGLLAVLLFGGCGMTMNPFAGEDPPSAPPEPSPLERLQSTELPPLPQLRSPVEPEVFLLLLLTGVGTFFAVLFGRRAIVIRRRLAPKPESQVIPFAEDPTPTPIFPLK